MSKKILCAGLVLCLLLCTAGCEKDSSGEDMYFAMPDNTVHVSGGFEKVPYEIYHYGGGDEYTLAYTLPDSDNYVLCIKDSTLYYVKSDGGAVTCVDLKNGTEQIAGELENVSWVRSMVAEGESLFVLCSNQEAQDIIYLLSAEKNEVIASDANLIYTPAAGDGGLFYVNNQSNLMRYDIESAQTREVAQGVSGSLEYDGGYVYASGENCYRFNVETGEKSFVHRFTGCRVLDGWLYYPDEFFCEEQGYYEILRRNIEKGTIESCGKAYLPYLGATTFAKTVLFGEKGFIACCTDRLEETEYMYFPYSDSQGYMLSESLG